MSYEIIEPPFTLKFREMSKKELKDYYAWFMNVMPERINVLVDAVTSTLGYEEWNPDSTPQSLDTLGKWFLMLADKRPRTQEEIDAIQNQTPFNFAVPDQELTNKTFSIAIDIGMYLSQVFLKNHDGLEWSQPFNNKRYVDYGQPVLLGFGAAPFNPVRMVVVQAYGLDNRTRTGKILSELYKIWSDMAIKARSD